MSIKGNASRKESVSNWIGKIDTGRSALCKISCVILYESLLKATDYYSSTEDALSNFLGNNTREITTRVNSKESQHFPAKKTKTKFKRLFGIRRKHIHLNKH